MVEPIITAIKKGIVSSADTCIYLFGHSKVLDKHILFLIKEHKSVIDGPFVLDILEDCNCS